MSYAPFAAAGIVIQIHIVAATAALLLGAYVLAARKGTLGHRLAGRAWVAAMLVTAIGSFWIKGHDQGQFSWIHGLSVVILLMLAAAIWSIRSGRVRAHRRFMIGTYLGLVGAAIPAALAPHRILGQMLFG
jgi:uncharacterized membrane protein